MGFNFDFSLYTLYLICAVAGGLVVLIRLVMMVAGLDHGDAPDVSTDLDMDHDGVLDSGDGSMNFFSIQSISGFFTMFGLVGLGLLQINVAEIWTLIGGLAAGIFTAWCTALIFMTLRKLQSDGTLVMDNAVGQTGTVYLTIPETGTGSVNVTVQGSQRTMDAMSQSGRRIPTGNLVKVVGITAGKILVVTDQVPHIE